MRRIALPNLAAAAIAAALPLGAGESSAAVIGYQVAWTGGAGYTMAGAFTFDELAAADGRIDESELLTLSIEGFLSGASIGAWDLSIGPGAGALAFNFNFDPVAETFFVGGPSFGDEGQAWNALGDPGLGFASGTSQALTLDGAIVGPLVPVGQSTLSAARQVTAAPEPAALPLLLGGFAALLRLRRR